MSLLPPEARVQSRPVCDAVRLRLYAKSACPVTAVLAHREARLGPSAPFTIRHYGLLRGRPEKGVRELPRASHSITTSALLIREGGTVMPRAAAAFRLRNRSSFVTCWTGRSDGFSPLRTRPA